MECPACSRELKQVNAAEVTVDICEGGCGGIWFDQFELIKFDEPHESDGGLLLDINRDPNISVDSNKKRNCPKCINVDLRKHFFSIKKEVEVDECFKCAGFWLDYAELLQIREQFKTEEERAKATDQYIGNIVNKKLEYVRATNGDEFKTVRKMINILSYLGWLCS